MRVSVVTLFILLTCSAARLMTQASTQSQIQDSDQSLETSQSSAHFAISSSVLSGFINSLVYKYMEIAADPEIADKMCAFIGTYIIDPTFIAAAQEALTTLQNPATAASLIA